jgi:hypothetical protein
METTGSKGSILGNCVRLSYLISGMESITVLKIDGKDGVERDKISRKSVSGRIWLVLKSSLILSS